MDILRASIQHTHWRKFTVCNSMCYLSLRDNYTITKNQIIRCVIPTVSVSYMINHVWVLHNINTSTEWFWLTTSNLGIYISMLVKETFRTCTISLATSNKMTWYLMGNSTGNLSCYKDKVKITPFKNYSVTCLREVNLKPSDPAWWGSSSWTLCFPSRLPLVWWLVALIWGANPGALGWEESWG